MCTAARGFEDFKNWRSDVHLCSSWRYFAWHSWPSLAECERVGPAPQDGYRCDVAILSTNCARHNALPPTFAGANAAELHTSARNPERRGGNAAQMKATSEVLALDQFGQPSSSRDHAELSGGDL